MTNSDTDAGLETLESTAPAVIWAVPLLGAIVMPALWWTSSDAPFAFRPDLMGLMTLIAALVAFGLFAVLSHGFKRRIRWALGVATTAMIVGFQWRMFTRAGEALAESTGIGLVGDLLPVGFGLALLWITVRLAGDLPFALIMGGGMAAVVAVLGGTTLSLVAPAPVDESGVRAVVNPPDTLLIVLDGYGRADWLEQEFGFDNSPFLSALEARGFAVAAKATSNYGYTYASVASMLHLDYVFLPSEVTEAESVQMRAALTGASGLIPAFATAGYETVYFENAWGGSQCGSGIDWCVRDGLVERSLWNMGQMTILAPLLELVWADPFNDLSGDHLAALDDVVSAPRSAGKPRFTFAHMLLPHDPLTLNADCSRGRRDKTSEWGPERGDLLAQRRARYIDQLRCVNSLVLEAVDAFLTGDPEGIVMITGDHGPGSILDPNVDFAGIDDATISERMRTLSAYRLSGCESALWPAITPVNGARAVANCALQLDLGAIADRNFWADFDGEGAVAEITSEIDR